MLELLNVWATAGTAHPHRYIPAVPGGSYDRITHACESALKKLSTIRIK